MTGGGDGTFTTVVTAVVKEARARGQAVPRFGLLRLGTGNALAWVLGASQAKGRGLAADLQRLRTDAGSRDLRLVECEGVLSPFCGFGIDAVALADYHAVKSWLAKSPFKRLAPGVAGYAISASTRTVPGYLVRKTPHCRVVNLGSDAYRVGLKGRKIGAPVKKGSILFEGPARIAAASTIPYYGFGFRVFPYAEDRSDRFNLRISNISSVEFVQNFRAIWKGRVRKPRHDLRLLRRRRERRDGPAHELSNRRRRGGRARPRARAADRADPHRRLLRAAERVSPA